LRRCRPSIPLRSLPVRQDQDRSVIRDLDSETEAAAIVHAIVDLGSALGMVVTAEGVETAELRAQSVPVSSAHPGAHEPLGSHAELRQ
jgi:predicted signal transduction protein with EAL and GGDEF domain